MDRGNVMLSSLNRTSTPVLSACDPTWCDRLSTTSYNWFCRRVGLPESVPNDAIPEIDTAGPIGSLGGAFRSLRVNCARVSFTVVDERLHVLLNPTVCSTLSRPADAVDALKPPAPREFCEVTLYCAYRTLS